jgi:hypothetical protein
MAEINKITKQHYTDYATVRSFMKEFGLDTLLTEDVINETILEFCDSHFDSSCFRDFKKHTNVVEFHHGTGKDNINTYFFPIIRISRVIMYNQLLQSMRTFLDTELIVQPDRGEIFLPPIYPAFLADKPFMAILGNIFIPGRYNIEVDYDYGYENTPSDIKMAATKWVAVELLKKQGAQLSYGMTSRTIDGYSEAYGKIPYEGLIATWNKDIDTVIARNKKLYARAI